MVENNSLYMQNLMSRQNHLKMQNCSFLHMSRVGGLKNAKLGVSTDVWGLVALVAGGVEEIEGGAASQ